MFILFYVVVHMFKVIDVDGDGVGVVKRKIGGCCSIPLLDLSFLWYYFFMLIFFICLVVIVPILCLLIKLDVFANFLILLYNFFMKKFIANLKNMFSKKEQKPNDIDNKESDS